MNKINIKIKIYCIVFISTLGLYGNTLNYNHNVVIILCKFYIFLITTYYLVLHVLIKIKSSQIIIFQSNQHHVDAD